MSTDSNERVDAKPELTAERALELSRLYAGYAEKCRQGDLDADAREYGGVAHICSAFAEQQATIEQLAESLLIYAQHYPSCDGQTGADGCCECGLTDWITKARELSPDGRGGDYLMWHRDVTERNRTIEELREEAYWLGNSLWLAWSACPLFDMHATQTGSCHRCGHSRSGERSAGVDLRIALAASEAKVRELEASKYAGPPIHGEFNHTPRCTTGGCRD